MITRAAADDDGGLLRPLRQFELEEQERIRLLMLSLEREFQREFGSAKPSASVECGPEPWDGFLDLSLI